MEYRKLISFGKSSYVVSLPKSWIVQNKLKKGDLIYMEEKGSNILLGKEDHQKDNEEKTKLINIDGKSLPRITREVNSSYILNYKTITIKGRELKDKIKDLQQVFQNLIALEIMEQTSDTIIAKDFLNMEQVSMDELIHKMDVITRTMIKESINNIFQDNYENINERDNDVNRLYFLLYRAVLYNLNNPLNAIKKFKLNSIDILNCLFVGFYIEGIADESRRIARFSRHLKFDIKEKTVLSKFLEKVNSYYLETIKAIYNKDLDLALNLSEKKKELNTELDAIERKNSELNFNNTISRTRRLISYVHNLGRITYQGFNYLEPELPER